MSLTSGQATASLKTMQPSILWQRRGSVDCLQYCDAANACVARARRATRLPAQKSSTTGATIIGKVEQYIPLMRSASRTHWLVVYEGVNARVAK